MKSIERKFNKNVEKNPGSSSYICFNNIVTGANFSEARLRIMFDKLVDKSDYVKSEKKGLVNYSLSLNNRLNRIENRGLFDPE
jgi:uncharacterized protein YktA (UPF0223 family)